MSSLQQWSRRIRGSAAGGEPAVLDAELPGTPAGGGQQHRPGFGRLPGTGGTRGSDSRVEEEEGGEPGRSKSTGTANGTFYS